MSLDLDSIRKRWWLGEMAAYSGLLWGVEDVRALVSEVERLRRELADLRARGAPSTEVEDRATAEPCSLNTLKTS